MTFSCLQVVFNLLTILAGLYIGKQMDHYSTRTAMTVATYLNKPMILALTAGKPAVRIFICCFIFLFFFRGSFYSAGSGFLCLILVERILLFVFQKKQNNNEKIVKKKTKFFLQREKKTKFFLQPIYILIY